MFVPDPSTYLIVLGILLVSATWLIHRQPVVFRVPARLDSIRLISSMLIRSIRRERFADDEAFHCRLALDEACMNIIEHAYSNSQSGEIEVAIRVDSSTCVIRLTDFGDPYDPSGIAHPLVGLPLEDAQPGGLGLYFMRTVMDEVYYAPGPNGNSLTMIKRRHSS